MIAIIDNNGYILSPLTIAPVNRHDTVFLPESLNSLARITRSVGIDIKGAILNLDAGFDSKKNRKCIFNRGIKPNIKENLRNRKKSKRGRKRMFDEKAYALRMRVERTFAWEDKFKRLLIRFEQIQSRHLGFKLIAYTLINLREFCIS